MEHPLRIDNDFEKRLLQALAVHGAEPSRGESPGTPAAVLALFGFSEASSPPWSDPELLLTVRTERVETHKGQVALPGGVQDPEDEREQGLITTALRETEEEVGIPRQEIRVLGQLQEISTSTGFRVTPIVGLLAQPIERIRLNPNPAEIAQTFWVPMSVLTHPDTYSQEHLTFGKIRYLTHVYQVGPHRVWGATGRIIKNLLDRLASLS